MWLNKQAGTGFEETKLEVENWARGGVAVDPLIVLVPADAVFGGKCQLIVKPATS